MSSRASRPCSSKKFLGGPLPGEGGGLAVDASPGAEPSEGDPILRPLYPDDLAAAQGHLCGFLVQYWGGPADYSDDRGHPRLRMRHMPFAIGLPERDAWYRHMAAAVKAGGLPADDELAMLRYFAGAATQLTKRP